MTHDNTGYEILPDTGYRIIPDIILYRIHHHFMIYFNIQDWSRVWMADSQQHKVDNQPLITIKQLSIPQEYSNKVFGDLMFFHDVNQIGLGEETLESGKLFYNSLNSASAPDPNWYPIPGRRLNDIPRLIRFDWLTSVNNSLYMVTRFLTSADHPKSGLYILVTRIFVTVHSLLRLRSPKVVKSRIAWILAHG